MSVATPTAPVTAVPRRRLVTGGALGGLVGSICCMIGAIAVGVGLAGASFATTVMDRYQRYAMAASLVFLVVWLVRAVRRSGFQVRGLSHYRKPLLRHVAVMGTAYAATIAVAFGVSAAITAL